MNILVVDEHVPVIIFQHCESKNVGVAGIHSFALRGLCEFIEPASCPVSFFGLCSNESTVMHVCTQIGELS